jgi:hypothetical protein
MTDPKHTAPKEPEIDCDDLPKLTAEEWAYIAEIEDSEPEDDA